MDIDILQASQYVYYEPLVICVERESRFQLLCMINVEMKQAHELSGSNKASSILADRFGEMRMAGDGMSIKHKDTSPQH